MVSCDLIDVNNGLLVAARELLKESLPGIKPEQIILNATHTHAAPFCSSDIDSKSVYGIELDAMSPAACQEYISKRIAKAAEQAWKNRKPGGISYGLGHAVVGHNRLITDFEGKSTMYKNTGTKDFSHIEGSEDHSVNLLYTWDKEGGLTGIVINVACPSQVSAQGNLTSADFWHDTRLEVRRRLGSDVYILPQTGAAGDQSPHIMVDSKAEERMQQLMTPDSVKTGRGTIARRKQIAKDIADAVMSALPYIKDNIEWEPEFDFRRDMVELPRKQVSVEYVNEALREAEEYQKEYERQLLEIEENPGMKKKPGWYNNITKTYTLMDRAYSVKDRYDFVERHPSMQVEVHVLRIGDVVFATNPFELYVDYGIRIKARSPAVQTFLIQLTGTDTHLPGGIAGAGYLPTSRAEAGGGYGSTPESALVGSEGGQQLVEETLKMINILWDKK